MQKNILHSMSKGSNKENFIDDLQNPDNCITHIDFAQAYQCELQKETMRTSGAEEV